MHSLLDVKKSLRVLASEGYQAILFSVATLLAIPVWADDTPPSYTRDVRPILSDNCFACHGPDEHGREAGLRLDTAEGATVDLGGYAAIVPGDADASAMIERIVADDESLLMPPPESHKTIDADQLAILRRWIDAGAVYEQHWAYRKLDRPQDSPADAKRVIDSYIEQYRAERKVPASASADKRTLARRLYIDLLGVPPTPAEVDAFEADTSSDAWQSLVDRLLADPRYGERMAVVWLDLVRYADTIGYHSDNHMEVSAYRDYVIDAFNANKPFDEFTIEQLAGDLLPKATLEQRVASGYNRLLQTTEEGGAQAKEYMAIYAADRVRNVSGVWLGSTMGCAQCHDHKYDPFTMRDFYSMAAFFADIEERAVGDRQPNLTVTTPEEQAQLDQLASAIDRLRVERLLAEQPDLQARLSAFADEWQASADGDLQRQAARWRLPTVAAAEATGGAQLQTLEDGSLLSQGDNPDKCDYTLRLASPDAIRSIRIEALPDESFPVSGSIARGNGNIVLTDLELRAGGQELAVAEIHADYQQQGFPATAAIDDNSTSGWAVEGHHHREPRYLHVVLKEPVEVVASGQAEIEVVLRHQSIYERHAIGRLRVLVSDDSANHRPMENKAWEDLEVVLSTPVDQRTNEQQSRLIEHCQAFQPELQQLEAERQRLIAQRDQINKNLRTMLVSKSLAKPRMTRVLARGSWQDESGEVVLPAVPEFLLHEAAGDDRLTRLDLANWLVARDNPLVARAFVNRLWKLYFGRGLSANLDDLGGQGAPPTHPELLDWLAVEFIESGWNVKHLARLIVTSDAYQRSSVASGEAAAIDPDNQWYGRQGRWRMEAEFVRDTALSLGGLLADDLRGGKSVKPYQPAGYWQHLNFPTRKWKQDNGDALYRRSVYTFWCRSFLHPSLVAFDAPSREECTAQRARSNIPQQALVLLNDPIFVESARAFAQRIAAQPGEVDQKIAWACRQAFSRDATQEELALLRKLHTQQELRFANAPDDAKRLIEVGESPVDSKVPAAELATWTQVARAILSAYETTSRN